MKRRLGTIAALVLGLYSSFYSPTTWPSSVEETLRADPGEIVEYSALDRAPRTPRTVPDSVGETATIGTTLGLALALALRQATAK